jgi:hypothetical protein
VILLTGEEEEDRIFVHWDVLETSASPLKCGPDGGLRISVGVARLWPFVSTLPINNA